MTLTFYHRPKNQYRVHPLVMGNVYAKFDEDTNNGLVFIMHN